MFYNKVTLIGRLVKDPTINESEECKKCGRFVLEIDRGYKTADGKKCSDFISIICWNKLADVAEEYLQKGNLILIDGQIHSRKYENQGETNYVTEVTADRIKFLDGKKETPVMGDLDENGDLK